MILNSSAWEICLFFPVYLLNHLYYYGCADTYFVLWVISQYKPCNFIAQFVQLWPSGGCLIVWLSCPSDTLSSLFLFVFLSFPSLSSPTLFSSFLALSYFLALQDASGSPCIFPASLRISHFSKDHWFHLMDRVFETKIWLLGANSLL